MNLVKNGTSPYQIILPVNAAPAERYAASELSHFLARMTGVELPVYGEHMPKMGPEVLIGRSRRTEALGLETQNLGEEAYSIAAKDGNLVIIGGSPRGTLYGVYGFLQDVLGFRFFAPGCTKVPKSSDITLDPALYLHDEPDFKYRESNYYHILDGATAARMRQNGAISRLKEEHGGKHAYVPGYYVHTFVTMLPPEEYYEEHPEYFALVNGKRTNEPHGKACMTNPDVLKICTEKALAALRAHPEATIISISQNDGMDPCECEECQKVVAYEGSESGSILHFVNAVADAVAAEFPHVMVDTLAYVYSSKPPLHVKPRPNVQIRLCSYECCFTHPMGTCDLMPNNARHIREHSKFAEEIVGWGKLTNRLAIWDYVVDFEFYNQMHPNLHVLGPNMRFLKEHNVYSVFCESQGQGAGGEFAELRAYLLTRLMWDVNFDTDVGIQEFCDEWFGPASEFIQEYIAMITDAVLKSGWHLNLFDNPNAPYVTPALLEKADELFDKAEAAVADDTVRLQRVRKERLAVRFAKFFFPGLVSDREAEVEAYMADAASLGVTRFSAKWGRENVRRLALRGMWPPHADDMTVIPDR
jgi:hypothetical protein